MGFPGGSNGKESACSAGDLDLMPELGRSPGEGNGNPLQYSGLENSRDYLVHGVAKSETRLSNFCFHGGLVTKLCPTLATLWTVAHQAPLSVGFPMQEYWSRLPFHSPEDLPNLTELVSPALQADSLPLNHQGSSLDFE